MCPVKSSDAADASGFKGTDHWAWDNDVDAFPFLVPCRSYYYTVRIWECYSHISSIDSIPR